MIASGIQPSRKGRRAPRSAVGAAVEISGVEGVVIGGSCWLHRMVYADVNGEVRGSLARESEQFAPQACRLPASELRLEFFLCRLPVPQRVGKLGPAAFGQRQLQAPLARSAQLRQD